MRRWIALVVLAMAAWGGPATAAGDMRLLAGFEEPSEIAALRVEKGAGERSGQHATQGANSLKLPRGARVRSENLATDWDGYESLEMDIFSESLCSMSVMIGDEGWQREPTHWNCYNADYTLRPGGNRIIIPLGGLFRGELGSRYNDLRTSVDLKHIVRLELSFSEDRGSEAGSVHVDNLRLTREPRPANVIALDFGPESQAISPGFLPVSPSSTYSPAVGSGWTAGSKTGPAWDASFPSRLLQDSIDTGDATFRVRVKPGKYQVLIFLIRSATGEEMRRSSAGGY